MSIAAAATTAAIYHFQGDSMPLKLDPKTGAVEPVKHIESQDIKLTNLNAAADNAAAAALGVPLGGVYRTNANPSVLAVRTA